MQRLRLTVFGATAFAASLVFLITTFLNQTNANTNLVVWQPACPPPVINGVLGSGSSDYPGVSGTLLGRLNRNGIGSACNAPKTCQLATGTGARAYDAYTFRNNGSATVCATVTLTVPQQVGANYQANTYLGGFDPNNICANYLADPGVSSATLSTPIVYSHNVPAGATFVVVVQTVNPGEIGGNYQIKIEGLPNCVNVCALNCPANVSAVTAGNAVNINYPLPTTVGSCQNISAVTCSPPSGSAFAIGTTPVSCSARDSANNTISCGFNVSVSKVAASIAEMPGCVGSGGVITASFSVTNNSGGSQSVSATANLPPQLLALSGRCSSSAGNCVVAGAATVNFTGTLAAGQTVTVNYLAQLADGVAKGAQLCVNTSISLGAGQPAMLQSCVTVSCDPAGEGLPLPTALSGDASRPGSILIFPIVTSSATSGQSQNTRISLTNVDPSRTINLHLFFIDSLTCQVSDMYLCLTANQTTGFLASDIDPGTTGFLVVVAVDEQGCPINFNQLIGDEYVKFSSGHAANLGAESIPAIAGGLLRCPGESPETTLRFDGLSYAPLPRVVATSNFSSRSDGNETLLILNRIGGNLVSGGTTTSAMTSLVYDDVENAYSFTFNLTCQYRGSVWVSTRAQPRFETVIPSGRSGWARYYNDNLDEAFLGATINFNRNLNSQTGAFNAGHSLHKVSYTTSAAYTIPVFPPSC